MKQVRSRRKRAMSARISLTQNSPGEKRKIGHGMKQVQIGRKPAMSALQRQFGTAIVRIQPDKTAVLQKSEYREQVMKPEHGVEIFLSLRP